MNIEHTKIAEKIHLLTFDNQYDITSTFLRFQEYYESPNFRGKIFSLDEFKKWYLKTSPKGQSTGEFTYYVDWNGFNIPSYVLKPFYEGNFSPLSKKEEQLLEIFKNEKEPFYVIGVHKEHKKSGDLLKHEIAHGLFYTDNDYRDDVIETMSKFNTKSIKDELRTLAGYHEEVLDDEVHAYTLSGNLKNFSVDKELSKELEKLYEKYFKQ